MINSLAAPYAALVLRLSLAFLFFAHLYRKFAITGFDKWWNGMETAGYPGWVTQTGNSCPTQFHYP